MFENFNSESKMVWVDLETTGLWELDPNLPQREMLEIAFIVTDNELNELEVYESLVLPSQRSLDAMDPYVKEMHTSNGLLDKVKNNWAPSVGKVESEILTILNKHKTYNNYLYWTGNSIASLDLKFLGHYMPKLSRDKGGPMHYQSIDISGLRLALGFHTGINYIYPKPETHRALEDVRNCMKEYKYIMKHGVDGLPDFKS